MRDNTNMTEKIDRRVTACRLSISSVFFVSISCYFLTTDNKVQKEVISDTLNYQNSAQIQ